MQTDLFLSPKMFLKSLSLNPKCFLNLNSLLVFNSQVHGKPKILKFLVDSSKVLNTEFLNVHSIYAKVLFHYHNCHILYISYHQHVIFQNKCSSRSVYYHCPIVLY